VTFRYSPELVEEIGGRPEAWPAGGVSPLAELTVIGGLAQAAAGGGDLGLDEVGVLFAARLKARRAPAGTAADRSRAVTTRSGPNPRPSAATWTSPSPSTDLSPVERGRPAGGHRQPEHRTGPAASQAPASTDP
jgi:hypothetical protein